MSKRTKTILIVVGLLAAVGLFNYLIQMDPTQLAARGVGRDAHSHGDEQDDHEGQPGEVDLRQPIGPEEAPVVIQVLAASPGEIEMPLRPMMSAIVADYPGLLRIEFPAPDSDEFTEAVKQAGGVPMGLLINGEMIKEIPEAKLGFVTFQGSPAFEEWSELDVRLAVEHELEEAGVEFTPKVEHGHPIDRKSVV